MASNYPTLKDVSAEAGVYKALVEKLIVGVCPVCFQHLYALDIVLGRFDIATVGKILGAAFSHNGNTFGNIKFCQVMPAVAAGQQQAVHFLP